MTQRAGHRQVVKFSFYRVDPSWRGLSEAERERGKDEFCRAVDAFAGRLLVRSYSAVGLRGDVDFLLWQIGDRLEDIQSLAAAILGTPMGPCLSMPYSYLAMTRRSVYVSAEEAASRNRLHPADSRYLFVYPFVKTRDWYQLPLEERQAMMDQHIAIGRTYPSVKLNTTYSFGLDDQEFVVSFETNEPADFLDLVMELREARSSLYTLRDTPVFTCIARPLRETLDTLGAPGEGLALPSLETADPEWTRVADLSELPEGAGKVVYHRGDQVALFNTGGRFFGISNRCSHANGPLADGVVDGATVICPHHNSRFDLATGCPLDGPANRALTVYDVRVEADGVYIARRTMADTTDVTARAGR